jgi:hypothetical protein
MLVNALRKLWNLPNSVLGMAYGVMGHTVGWLAGTKPRVSIGNNAIQFHNNGLMLTAMTLGNVIIYGPRLSPDRPNVSFQDSPCGHTVGREEFRHTQQGELLGPLYLPAHLAGGIASLCCAPHARLTCKVDAWHRNNFMETGPMCDRVF